MKRKKGPDETDLILGRRRKSLRVRRGLSQTAMGKLLGVSFQQIQKFERGAHRMRVSQLWRVADGLGVAVTQLLGIPGTDTNEITDMIDTPIARRLMEAFQHLTSGERRCLVGLAEEIAARGEIVQPTPPQTLAATNKSLALSEESRTWDTATTAANARQIASTKRLYGAEATYFPPLPRGRVVPANSERFRSPPRTEGRFRGILRLR